MGNPAVVFTTYGEAATTNVSGHSNSTSFIELKSDLVPRSGQFSNGDFQVSDFDTLRIRTTSDSIASNGTVTGEHTDTFYSTRNTLGTFSLKGGQFELCAFDSGEKGSSVEDHIVKSGVNHNYIAFTNTGDGLGLVHSRSGSPTTSTAVVGPPTAYAGTKPFANIEFDVSHDSSPLQAIAGGGTTIFEGTASGTGATSGVYVQGVFSNTVDDGGESETRYWFNLDNEGARTGSSVLRRSVTEISTTFEADNGQTVTQVNKVTANNTSDKICENWFPGATYSPSTTTDSVHQGTIKFRIHPDSEYVLADNQTTTNVDVDSVTIAANGAIGPIATHSRVTVTTDGVHGLTDNQNQIVITGCDNPTHINGIHNVYSVTSTTVFDFMIIKSTVPSGQTCEGDIKLQTYDGIDKTGAIIKESPTGGGAGIAEVVHGGCAGNNIVLLRGDTSSNISLGRNYYVYTDNSASSPISTIKFASGPTYKSMFREMGLFLDENTGRISSNGAFAGGTSTDVILSGGYITLENDTPKTFGTEFILQEGQFEGKIETEDFVHTVRFADSGLNELDSYFYKFKHARDYALNRVKTDGTITQTGDTVTIQGVDAATNRLLLENDFVVERILTEGGYFTIALESGSQTFPTKYANALPTPARYKTLEYQNGFTTNVSYASSESELVVQSNAEISLSTDTDDGESYRLTYTDTSWPVTNSSSYWFLDNIENSPVVDSDQNLLIFKTTSEGTNFKVHFTIRAQKVHGQMGVYTGGAGTSTAASVLNTIDGWGDAFETGTGNYYDGYFYVSVYNNTDSDRDDQIVVFSDQNNAITTTLDFNGNAFKHRDDPDDPDTEISILNEEALANSYSNGNFTVLDSI